MLKAILFDLDNTLILFDEQKYFKSYIGKISQAFSDLMPVELFYKKLISATQALLQNNGDMSNADFFMNEFSSDFEDKREVLWNRFLEFYKTEYDQFETLVSVPNGVRDLFIELRKRNIKLVIATNPMFPIDIQKKRISWAGIGDLEFELITHIENMSYCKPRIEYYQQICQMIGEEPQDCLMVGNDPFNDMVVAGIGMKTYLTVDGSEVDASSLALSKELRKDVSADVPNPVPEPVPEPDFTGPLSKLIDAVEQLQAQN